MFSLIMIALSVEIEAPKKFQTEVECVQYANDIIPHVNQIFTYSAETQGVKIDRFECKLFPA